MNSGYFSFNIQFPNFRMHEFCYSILKFSNSQIFKLYCVVGFLDRIFKSDSSIVSFRKQLRNVLGFVPGNAVLYKTALTHRSVKESSDQNNERLEYLGDAILSAIIADFLFKKYPYKEEGFLTEMRSKMVNRVQLNDIAVKMGLRKISYFNKFDGSLKMSQIFGNTLEAVVGAIYLDKGYDKGKTMGDGKNYSALSVYGRPRKPGDQP